MAVPRPFSPLGAIFCLIRFCGQNPMSHLLLPRTLGSMLAICVACHCNGLAEQPKIVQSATIGQTAVTVTLVEGEEDATFSLTSEPSNELLGMLKGVEPSDFPKWMRICVQDARGHEQDKAMINTVPTAILGSYALEEDRLLFQSRFPLNPRVQYTVTVRDRRPKAIEQAEATLVFKPLGIKTPSSTERVVEKVTAVYPSADRLPENLLKFYIHFSVPMSRGEAYQRIHLMHGDEEVIDPFLELGEELWDHQQTRFTLFIHPGRIKRGVKPREDDGLPMTAGNTYRLVIDSQWKTADRQPLADSFTKTFQVVAADDQQPTPEKWKIETPKAQTNDKVKLIFNESLDHAMLQRVLIVRDITGQTVQGRVEISQRETQWEFQPETPWKPGTYAIEIETNLEDYVAIAWHDHSKPHYRQLPIRSKHPA